MTRVLRATGCFPPSSTRALASVPMVQTEVSAIPAQEPSPPHNGWIRWR